jgi:acyl-CoA thioesterase
MDIAMSISQLLSQAEAQDHVDIPEGWGQGRATFGGLIAGLMFSRLVSSLGEAHQDRVLRSATISFISAVTAGRVEFSTEIFRSGKSVTQAAVRLMQNGEVTAILLASFGSARESRIVVGSQPKAPDYKKPEDLTVFPYIAGVMPEFFQQTNLCLAQGGMPFSGSGKPDFGGWMRWKDSFPQMTIAHLLALIDAWPPSVFPLFDKPSAASTLCWTVEFLAHSFHQSSDSWWQYQVVTDAAESGYVHAGAHIWDDEGNLVAISRQTTTIFA